MVSLRKGLRLGEATPLLEGENPPGGVNSSFHPQIQMGKALLLGPSAPASVSRGQRCAVSTRARADLQVCGRAKGSQMPRGHGNKQGLAKKSKKGSNPQRRTGGLFFSCYSRRTGRKKLNLWVTREMPEVRIRVPFFSVVFFSRGTLTQKRVKGHYWGTYIVF